MKKEQTAGVAAGVITAVMVMSLQLCGCADSTNAAGPTAPAVTMNMAEHVKMLDAQSQMYEAQCDSLERELCIANKRIVEYKGIWQCYMQWCDDNGVEPPCRGNPIDLTDCDNM